MFLRVYFLRSIQRFIRRAQGREIMRVSENSYGLWAAISLCLLVALFGSDGALAARTRAAPRAAASWPQEPVSFMGFLFGVSLESQAEECRSRDFDRRGGPVRRAPPEQPGCYQRISSVEVKVVNPPEVGFPVRLNLLLVDRVVQGALLRFNHEDWERITDLLRAKYGEPKKRATAEYLSATGLKIEGQEWSWAGRKVQMRAWEFAARTTEGEVLISTDRLRDNNPEGAPLPDATRRPEVQRYLDNL